ncbi:RHS repeat-associated core domain-containing protein [Methylomonas methanica]|uniref:RHS repeat-associated core domain protein n=1 Tax=Methylomonas methanica (strain DSM 25384 / MC09) TaxID=857087 RepID=F9ZWQ9_METMM|nr:RHS repeat-associated core domain-containing protein [Methylomonas methanica]AEG00906.1 RHS repeat-associated core domain protein [Methylomonas methanica MC09]
MQNNAPRKMSRLPITVVLAIASIAVLAGLYVGKQTADSVAPMASLGSADTQTAKPTKQRTGAAKPDFDTIAEAMAATYIGDGRASETENWSKGIASESHDTQQLLSEFSSTYRPNNLSPQTEQLRQKRDSFLSYRSQIEAWLASRDMENSGLAEQVRDRFEQLDAAFDKALNAKTDADRQRSEVNLQSLLQRLASPAVEVRGRPQPTFTQQAPTTLTPDDTPNAFPPVYTAPAGESASLNRFPDHSTTADESVGKILDILGIGAAQASQPQAASPEADACGFQPEDLGDALPEVDLNAPETLALAEKLQYSPVKIYEYVKNHIEFQPYLGSLKGAAATLVSGSGNATDQASLLIALLRTAKIPARYVQGEIRFPSNDQRLLDWLGVKAAAGAANRLSAGQIPKTWNASNISFTHVWVEACVPYGNYRGSRNDDSSFHWIPLDPSFKEMSYTDETTIADLPNFNFDYNAYLSKRTTVMPHEALLDQMEAALGKSLVHGGGYRGTIFQRHIDILPSTLPYEVKNFKDWGNGYSETASLPDSHRYFAQVTVKNQAGAALAPTVNRPMAELAASRLTLSFVQTNASNTATGDVAAWQSGTAMDVPCDPTGSAYQQTLVRPVIRQDGEDITPPGIYGSVGFCSVYNQLTLRLSLNNATINQVDYNNIGAHNYHALQIYAFQVSDELLEIRSAKLLDAVNADADPNLHIDDTLGEYLHVAGLKYMDYTSSAAKAVGRLYGETGDSGNHIGLTSTAMKVEYVFDLPFAVSRKGLLVDVPGGSVRTRNIVNGGVNYEAYLLSGYSSSAYESYIWQEQAHVDAVSTVRGLQFANDTGLPVVVLNSSADVDTLLNIDCATSPINQNYSAATKQLLKNLFINNSYFKITLPRCLINYDGWGGAVWVAEKATLDGQGNIQPNTTATTSYTISGEYLTAQGGYSLASPISNTYSSWLNTGYQGVFNSATSSVLAVGSVSNNNIKLSTPDFGLGSNTGFVAGNTTVGGDPVNLVSGNLYHPERDFAIKGRGGLDMVFERNYNSNVRKDGPLGYGWTHSFNHQLLFFDEDANGLVDTAIWLDGSGAANRLSIAETTDGVALNASFMPQTGLHVTAKRESNGEYSLKEKSGLTFYFQNVSGTSGQTASLTRVVDRNDNVLGFDYSGENLSRVTDGIGRTLNFWYDNGDNHITRITDWTGRTYRYGYDSQGDLVKYETPDAVAGLRDGSTTYSYYQATDGTNLEHALKSYTRPNGNAMRFEYYANGKTFRHTDSEGHSYTFRYNKFRRETTTVDERGVSQTHLFNEWGQPLQQLQGDGSRLIYEYTDSANPLSETRRRDALGHAVQYAYDAAGNVTAMTQPDGSTVTYEDYNAFNLPAKTKDANGNYTLYRYDARGNRTDTIALKPGVNTDTPTPAQIAAWIIQNYDESGNLTRSKRVRDFTTQAGPYIDYGYDDSALNPVTIERCGLQQLGAALVDQCISASQSFDNLGRPTRGIDARFYPAETSYSADGQLTRATDGLRQWRDFAYDNNGNPVGVSLAGFDAQGNYGLLQQAVMEYDTLDRRIVQRDTAGHATRIAYDETGNVAKLTNPDGYSVSFEYDAVGRPTRAFDALGNAVATEYDQAGRPLKVTDPNGLVTQYTYYGASGNGRLQRLTSPDGSYTDYSYDANGNVVRSVDNGGRETLTDYDALRRPVKTVGPVHDALGLTGIRQVTEIEYSSLGDVQTVRAGYRAANGTETLNIQANFVYDDFGRVIEQSDALGHTTRWVYDEHGQPIRRESPNGHIVEWEYDNSRNGLLTRQTAKLNDTDPAPHVTDYTYDALGQVLSVAAPEVGYQYTYDNAQRLETVTDSRGGKTLTYRHSPGGLIDSLEDNEGGRQDFLYDAVGRLSAIRAADGGQTRFIYDAGGRLRETAMPNGYSSLYRYNAGGRLEELVNRMAGGAEVSRHAYSYDAQGRRDSHLEIIDGTATDYRYQYDTLDRLRNVLTQDGGTSTQVEAYQYDAFGNRRQRTAQDGGVYRYLYDAAQQLTQVRSGSDTGAVLAGYSYDAAGNQTQRSGSADLALTYDALDRLAEAAGTGMATESYRYDHRGRRVETVSGGTATRYVYAGRDIWSEYGADWNNAQAHYVHAGLDHPLLRITASGTAYYHADGLGSVVATSNGSGVITASARYDAFGRTLAQTGGIPRYGYAGREPDATGLIYYRARYYDPALGRFAQRDPAGFADGINPYAYVGNSPVNFRDPLGLSKAKPVVVAASAFAGTSKISGYLDAFQTGLDVVGLVPGLGEPVDLVNGTIYAARGDKVNAGLSYAAAIPFAGWGATIGKFANKVDNAIGVRKASGGVDFVGSPDLYPVKPGQSNIVSIEYTGTRNRDFGAANEAAGFGNRQKPPSGYSWHHLDDYEPATNKGTMQLIKREAHEATYPHAGGVSQYEKATGIPYDLSDEARASIRASGTYIPGL